MKLQLIGLPLSAHRRLKDSMLEWASGGHADVRFRAVPSFHQYRPNIGEPEINAARNNVQDGYVHVAAVPSRDWHNLRNAFLFDCRVIELRFRDDPHLVEWDVLKESLEECIKFEKRWLQQICPADLRNALLLPPPSFEPEREVHEYWRLCDVYWNPDLLDQARRILNRVGAIHNRRLGGYVGHCWTDIRRRQFRSDPSRHGMTLAQRAGRRQFRFCFEVPTGFHYDVQSESWDEFWILDRLRNRHWVRHANVDPWGNLRA